MRGEKMIELAINDINQFQTYNYSFVPITNYSKSHINNSIYDKDEVKRLIPYAKQTNFILGTFSEIIDDLNYNKDKFENFIFTLDDDYDTLSDFISKLNPKLSIHKELYELSDKILTKLVKLQNELGLIIEQNEHKTI